MTAAEAKMRAASLVLEGMPAAYRSVSWATDPDSLAIAAELRLIETWLRRRACLGDKILVRQLEAPLGRQVKPPAKQQRALERLVKRAEKS